MTDATLWLAKWAGANEEQHLGEGEDSSGEGQIYIAEILRSRMTVRSKTNDSMRS